jgi:hypothetical protein
MGRKRKQPGEDAEDLTSGNDPQEHLPPDMNPPPGAVVLVQATDDPGSFFVQLDLGAAVETEEHPATIIAVEHKYGLDVDMEGEGGEEEEKDQEEAEEEEEEEEEGEETEMETTTVEESGVIDRAAIAAAMAPYPFLSVPEDPELARKGFAECTICAAKFRSGLAIKKVKKPTQKNPSKKTHPKKPTQNYPPKKTHPKLPTPKNPSKKTQPKNPPQKTHPKKPTQKNPPKNTHPKISTLKNPPKKPTKNGFFGFFKL